MTAVKARLRKTVEDFLKLPEGTPAELIDGEILMSPSPRSRHQRIVRRLLRILDGHVERRSLGEVFDGLDVHLPSGDVVEPDLVFVRSGRRIVRDWIRGVPDLVVEIMSLTSDLRDRVVKRRLYASNGVPEYWLVVPDEDGLEVMSLKGRVYPPGAWFTGRDPVRSRVLPGLRLRFSELVRLSDS